VLGAAPRRPCASSSCLRVHEPSSNRRPRPSRKSRKPKRGPTTPHGCTRGGWRACLPRTQREQRMQGAGRTGGAAVHAPGALTPSALASWPTPGAGAGPGEAGQPSWPHRRGSRASAAEWKRRGWPTRRRTMGGRCARRPSARRPVRMPRDCKPIRSNTAQWNRACAGARIRRPSARCGGTSPNVSRRGRCAPSSACWSTRACSARAVCTSARLTSRCRGTQGRQRLPRQRGGWPGGPREPWPHSG